jgi:hypothetical protein
VSKNLELGLTIGSGYTLLSCLRSSSDNPGRRVWKKLVKSSAVERFLGVNIEPSLVLNPVRMGTLLNLPVLKASIGRTGIKPFSPSITGWKGHRTEGLYSRKSSNAALETSFVLFLRSALMTCSSGMSSQSSLMRNLSNCSWCKGLVGV